MIEMLYSIIAKTSLHNQHIETGFFSVFLAFDFCRFCVVIRFFHPCHNGQ